MYLSEACIKTSYKVLSRSNNVSHQSSAKDRKKIQAGEYAGSGEDKYPLGVPELLKLNKIKNIGILPNQNFKLKRLWFDEKEKNSDSRHLGLSVK